MEKQSSEKTEKKAFSMTSLDAESDYEDTTNAEDYGQYKLDGYHPVYIGENYNNGRFTVVQKLGWGHFSTVWLLKEKSTGEFFALKIQKSKSNYFEAAMDELELLSVLNKESNIEVWNGYVKEYNEKIFKKKEVPLGETYVIKLIDSFVHIGMHGKHPCSVLELMGPNLLDLIQYFESSGKLMDLGLVKHITKQVIF